MNNKLDNIKLDGIAGTWYVIDRTSYIGKRYYLLESEEYGDEIPCIVTDDKFNVIYMNIYNGFDDLYDYLG